MKAATGKQVGPLTGAKWCAICYNAKQRGIDVDVTQKQAAALFEIQQGLCALSGVVLVLDAPRPKITASLDRIDSSRGYVWGNVRWVHKQVNVMKNDLDEREFLKWVRLIAQKQACPAT